MDFFKSYSDYRFDRIVGVAAAAGAEVKAEPPGSVIDEDVGISYRKVSRWNVTIPKKYLFRCFAHPCPAGVMNERRCRSRYVRY